MKTFMKYMVVMVVSLSGLTGNNVLAEKMNIPEIDSLDLGALAQDAAKEKKQLMVVYYKGKCEPCDQLSLNGTAGDQNGSQIAPDFVMYKTNVSAGFNVVCPNGEQFANEEFMSIKGIAKLPAVVITDSFGNVMYVENNVTSKGQLLAVSDKYKKRNMVSSKASMTGASD